MPARLKPQISTQQEELLWERKILSLQCSSGLIQAVIFYLIKSCGVFQGKDLRQLKTEHVNFGEDSVGNYVTIDFTSVMCSGKVVRHYDDPNNPRSLYKLLKTYISHLANEGAFLVRPISSIKDYICYSPWPLGVSIIEHMVQTLMEEAGQGSRYGNISASLLALDVLKSYGAGRHCLATWVDCFVGAALSYRVKVLNGKIPDCSPINCRDLNAEAGLIMSHLLDPPYPSGPSAVQDETKTTVEEGESQNSELINSNVISSETSSPREQSSSKSKPSVNRERFRVLKRGGVGLAQVRRIATGQGLNLHKKQARFVRLKSRDSQKVSSGTDQMVSPAAKSLKTAKVKTEPRLPDGVPVVEIDVAGSDCQVNAENSDHTCEDNGDEETENFSSVNGKRNVKAVEDDSNSSVSKVAKIEQHFQELEASICENLETFEDGSEQREDITLDISGELVEECQGIEAPKRYSGSPNPVNSLVKPNDGAVTSEKSCKMRSSQNVQEVHSSQKEEHLSLVLGLEQWLDRLKQRVNTGSDADMNGLLLQATSQLKVIADKVMAGKDENETEPGINHPVVNKNKAKSTVNTSDHSVKAQLIKQLGTVQHHRLFPHQERSVQEDLSSDTLISTSQYSDKQLERSNIDVDNLKIQDKQKPDTVDLDQDQSSGSVDSLASLVDDGLPIDDLSPPVLSPQPPTQVEGEPSSFLFNNLSPRKDEQDHDDSLVPCDRDNPHFSDISPTPKTSVPDLIKFLETANVQMQSLLSRPHGGNATRKSDGDRIMDSISEHSSGFTLTQSSSAKSKEQTLEMQPKKTGLKATHALNKLVSSPSKEKQPITSQLSQERPEVPSQGSSWPLLRSVLEEALLPPTSVLRKDHCPSLSGKLTSNSSSNTCIAPGPNSSSNMSCVPVTEASSPVLAAQSGMYTFQSDHKVGAAFQSLTVVSGDKRSEVFTFPDLPLDKVIPTDCSVRGQTSGGSSAAQALRRARSELCLGDYLPRGAVVPASSIKVLTQQGTNGLEVVLRFDFSNKDRSNV